MGLVQVGWVLPDREEPIEKLVNMTDSQEREVESILKEAYAEGQVTEYWLADAVVLPFDNFMRRVLRVPPKSSKR